jgi:type II secretory pathway pseudopilin PulG
MKRNRSGFTIVELLVYAGILTIFLYVMTNIFTSVLDMQLESETASAVVQDGGYILSRLTYDMGRASAIVEPNAIGVESARLVLRINNADYQYSAAGGNLFLSADVTSDALNSFGTGISNLSFRRYGNVNGKNSIRVAFTLASTTERSSGPEIREYQTTIGLR